MHTALSQELQRRGWRGRVVSIDRLRDVQNDIDELHRNGSFDETFAESLHGHFDFNGANQVLRARSLIVVAVGDPQVRFTFGWNGSHRQLVVPPTYLLARASDQRVEATLKEILEPEGYTVARAALPKKLLAVRSGLAEYGKNNIAFVPGMGSFVRLTVFYSDLPCHRDVWQEPIVMDRCKDCSACLRSCPTGAIGPDRFLLRAELCTTHHNEQPVDVEFPGWIDPTWHNCLVGCLRCQRVCPENRDVWGWMEEGAEFSSQETLLFLEGTPPELLPLDTKAKLERWDLAQLLELLPRNLRVLLDTRGEPRSAHG